MRLPESRTLRNVVGSVLILTALVYCADVSIFYLRSSRGSALGTVMVEQYMLLSLKGNKVEYNYIGTADVNCTRSLFPQRIESSWMAPCWWRERHRKVWIEATYFPASSLD